MAGSPKVGEYLCRPGGGSGRFSPLAGPSPEGEGTGHHPGALPSALPPLRAATRPYSCARAPSALPGRALPSSVDPAASFSPLWPFQGGFWARGWPAVWISIFSGTGTRPVWLQCLTLLRSQERPVALVPDAAEVTAQACVREATLGLRRVCFCWWKLGLRKGFVFLVCLGCIYCFLANVSDDCLLILSFLFL